MKLTNTFIIALLLSLCTSCQVIGDIFGAGVYVGIFISVLFVALIIYVISRISGKNKP